MSKKKKIIICLLIAGTFAITARVSTNAYYQRKLAAWMHDFYGRENFAFKEPVDSSGFSPILGVWQLSDLAQYKETEEVEIEDSNRDEYMTYFRNADNTLKWDNIAEWLVKDATDKFAAECDVFAELMLEMTDDDLEEVIELGQVKDSSFSKYRPSEALKNVASAYVIKTSEERRKAFPKYDFHSEKYDRLDGAEARALGFMQTVIEINSMPEKHVNVEISSKEYFPDEHRCKYYTYKVVPEGRINSELFSPVIVAYYRQTSLELIKIFTDAYTYDVHSMTKLKTVSRLPKNELIQVMSLIADIKLSNRYIEGCGHFIQVTRGNCAIGYVADIEFDEDRLFYYTKAYNVNTQADMSIDELKEHFFRYDEEFKDYADWWCYCGDDESSKYRMSLICELAERNLSIDEATPEQLEEASKIVDQKIKAE